MLWNTCFYADNAHIIANILFTFLLKMFKPELIKFKITTQLDYRKHHVDCIETFLNYFIHISGLGLVLLEIYVLKIISLHKLLFCWFPIILQYQVAKQCALLLLFLFRIEIFKLLQFIGRLWLRGFCPNTEVKLYKRRRFTLQNICWIIFPQNRFHYLLSTTASH